MSAVVSEEITMIDKKKENKAVETIPDNQSVVIKFTSQIWIIFLTMIIIFDHISIDLILMHRIY